jgi:very-short-patch-repair endonuclease
MRVWMRREYCICRPVRENDALNSRDCLEAGPLAFILGVGRKPLVPDALTRGPFTLEDARAAGLKRWHLEGASWKRLTRGIYIWACADESPMSMLCAASRRLPREAAFSGLTAAWLHGLDVEPCAPIEVVAPRAIGLSARAGMRVHRSLSQLQVVEVRGLRATTLVQSIVDICARVSLLEAIVVVDAALHARKLTISNLSAWALARPGRKGIQKLRRVISLAEPATESPMESRLRVVLVLGGLPKPKVQVPIHDREGRFVGRPDLYYEEAMLGIEFDGGVHRNALVVDNRRQNALLNAGVRLLRFTSADVMRQPASVVRQVRALLKDRI